MPAELGVSKTIAPVFTRVVTLLAYVKEKKRAV